MHSFPCPRLRPSPLALAFDRGSDDRGQTVTTDDDGAIIGGGSGRVKGVASIYRVRAFNADGNSACSNPASGVPR